jgi:hypothetical protein
VDRDCYVACFKKSIKVTMVSADDGWVPAYVTAIPSRLTCKFVPALLPGYYVSVSLTLCQQNVS